MREVAFDGRTIDLDKFKYFKNTCINLYRLCRSSIWEARYYDLNYTVSIGHESFSSWGGGGNHEYKKSFFTQISNIFIFFF